MNVVQIYRGADGQFYLRLVSSNGQVLAASEGYRTHFNAKRAASRNFAGIELRDLSKKPYRRFGA